MIRKSILLVIVSIMCLGLITGCGNSGKNEKQGDSGNVTDNNDTKENKSNEKITIEQLDYEVKSEVEEGKRYVMMKLTNNSKYMLTNFEITYKLKSDVTEKQKETIYKDIKNEFELNDEEVKKMKEQDSSIHAEIEKAVEVGDTVNKIKCYYFGGYYELVNIEHLEIYEPDIATIKFIDNNKIFTMYYDYSNDSYSYEDDTEDIDQWTTKEIGKKIPKPDAKYIISHMDEEDSFSFSAYGLTKEDFDKYVDECKEMGYIEDERAYEHSYSADNKDGYNIDLSFWEQNGAISVSIDKQ